MSCNGCRVLRKGCNEKCVLRTCLRWIDSPEAQGHATIFVAKFFGRAGLLSFVSAVPDSQKPALFRSLLFEACGRTVNPVTGAVGMLWEARWEELEAAVDAVLRGEAIRARSSSDGEAGTQMHTHCRTRMRKDERGESPSEGSVTTSDGVDGRTPGSAPPPVLLNLFP